MLKRDQVVKVLEGTRAPGLKPGSRGVVRRVILSGRYYGVRFGAGATAQNRVLAAAVVEPVGSTPKAGAVKKRKIDSAPKTGSAKKRKAS